MRTTLLSLLLVVASHAQAQFDFPTDNATWVNTLETMASPPPVPTWQLETANNYCVNGTDTVINAITYTMLERCTGGYKGAVREVAGRVFYIPGGVEQEYLLYDFTLEAGESAVIYYEPSTEPDASATQEVTVSNVEISTALGGRRMLHLDAGATWIEGIGSTWGLFTEPWNNVSNYRIELECMSHMGSVRFPEGNIGAGECALIMSLTGHKRSNSFTAYPNPTTDGLVRLQGLNSDRDRVITVTTVDGRTLAVPFTRTDGDIMIDLSDAAAGLYMVYLTQGQERLSQAVVRQ